MIKLYSFYPITQDVNNVGVITRAVSGFRIGERFNFYKSYLYESYELAKEDRSSNGVNIIAEAKFFEDELIKLDNEKYICGILTDF